MERNARSDNQEGRKKSRPDIIRRARLPIDKKLEHWANSFDVERVFTAATNGEMVSDLRKAVNVLRAKETERIAELAAENERLTAALIAAEQRGAPQWQPIATAPKDGTRIYGWSTEWFQPAPIEWLPGYNGRGWWVFDNTLEAVMPTHFQPLPAPPSLPLSTLQEEE